MEQGDVRWMLQRRIDNAHGIIHLVGNAYGAEPNSIDPDSGRESYTQFEARYAKQKGKQLWTIVVDDNYPVDSYEPEPEELQQLQKAYRQKILQSDELYYPSSTPDGLEATTLKLRQELQSLRRGFRRWTVAVITLLAIIITITSVILLKQNQSSKSIEQTAKTTQETKKVATETKESVKEVHSDIAESKDLTKETLATTKSAAATAELTQKNTEATRELVGESNREEKKQTESLTKIYDQQTLDSMAARVQKAVDAMNLSNQGQGKALEILLANGYTYRGSAFDGVDLSRSNLSKGQFSASTFVDADLSSTNLDLATLTRCQFKFLTAPELSARQAKAQKARFTLAELPSSDFSQSNIEQSSFVYANLSNSTFKNASCQATSFAYADLSNCDFSGADLTDAIFMGAILEGANFEGATFKNTDMGAALASDLKATAEQRAEFCRGGSPQGYHTFIIVRMVPSQKYDSGFTYDDWDRLEFGPIIGLIRGSLKLRQGGREPVGYSATWQSNDGSWNGGDFRIRLGSEARFLDVGDRGIRFKERINSHANNIVAKVQSLPTVHGDGKEFASWMKVVEKNSRRAPKPSILPLDNPNALVFALASKVISADDIPFLGSFSNSWYGHAAERYKVEWPAEGDSQIHSPDGWNRLYPKALAPFHDMPRENAEFFKDWTLLRAKTVKNCSVLFQFEFRRRRNPEKTVQSGQFRIFDDFAKRTKEYSSNYWYLPDELKESPTHFPGFRRNRILNFPKNRESYSILLDKELAYPLQIKVEARYQNYQRFPEKDRPDNSYDVISLTPLKVHITDKNGVTTSHKVSIN